MYDATAVILAGGNSSRFNGMDKSRIVINSRPLIEHTIEKLTTCFDDVLVVTGPNHCYNLPHVKIVRDQQPNCGPLMGLYCGLNASETSINFVIACDMPFINQEIIQFLLSHADRADVVVPIVNGYREPLMALYNKTTLPAIHKHIQQKKYKITAFYADVTLCEIPEEQIRKIDPQLHSFFNINTTEDLARAQQLFSDAPRPAGDCPNGPK